MASLATLPCKFARDERGTLTIEFLLWLPLLCFVFVTTVVFYDGFKSRSDAAKVAHTLGDITSRQVEVSDAFFDELFDLQEKLLPRVGAFAALRVTSIQYVDDQHVVLWSEARGGLSPLASENIPPDLLPEMADLDSVVLTEFRVPYTPLGNDWVGVEATTWSLVLVTRPRFVASIAKID